MAKGSQLSQLKAALSQAGLTGNHTNGKKRTRAINDKDKDRAKKAAKLQEIQQKLNPFDVKVTKVKHDVGGRKIRGVSGRPAQSKQAGLEQRKRTLLKEYEEKGHAGGIIDRRFGENDPTMSIEERMLERFTKERQRASRAGAFNLEDEDELTHYGQSLSNLDDFDNVGLTLEEDDEEDPGQISREAVEKAHFGGFEDESDHEDEPERKKSKAEVMAEVIAKSKEHK
ncbi:NOP14 family protein, partial [Pleurotus pulmonarius]